MFNNSGTNSLHCSEVHASGEGGVGGIASSRSGVLGAARVSLLRDWNASKS